MNLYPGAKRAFDFSFAALGLVVVSPVIAALSVAIKLGSKGPLFYRGTRVGLNGQPFRMLKFRTMVTDADQIGGSSTPEDDPRVTSIGKTLRRYKLDELPQLWNVLTGDMSFVGPRPERPEFVGELTKQIPFYGQRHIVRPGLTGWAQVRYTYGASVEDALQKLQYDLFYIKNMSIALDIFIIFATVKTVVLGKGA